MSFPFYIARRYLFAKKSHNVINIISAISVIGVAVGTIGLIIVLSVFNGFSDLVISLYDTFDPDIKITAKLGKSFDPSSLSMEEIKKTEGVLYVSEILEESALLKYDERQYIATVKGVGENWTKISNLDSNIIDGRLVLQEGDSDFAVIGGSIAYSLSMNLQDPFVTLHIFCARKEIGGPLSDADAFREKIIIPSGVFAIQQDFDSKYVIVPLRFMRDLTGTEKNISAYEIALDKKANAEKTIEQLKKIVGPAFYVKGRVEQHAFLNKILKSEKYAVYLILTFILLIATFNILGSLTMLIIDKKHDIFVLKTMGASEKDTRKIFLIEGLMISLAGGVSGLLLGGFICFLQQRFGLVRLGNAESFVIDVYPVTMQAGDFIIVFGIVFAIGLLAAWFTSRLVMKRNFSFRE